MRLRCTLWQASGLHGQPQRHEANPVKVDAIHNMRVPSSKKDVMKLMGMMAALGRFISKLGEKGLPFFRLLKKADKFT